MKKNIYRAFAIGTFLAACILLLYRGFFYDIKIGSSDTKNEATITSLKKQLSREQKKTESYRLDAAVDQATGKTNSSSSSAVSSSAPKVVTYKMNIADGTSTESVVDDLLAHKVIADKASFLNYLLGNGYENKIHYGTFTLRSDMSQEEMAKKLASAGD